MDLEFLRWLIMAGTEDNRRAQAALSYWHGTPAAVHSRTCGYDGAMQLQLVRYA